jgi:hypothetical protein
LAASDRSQALASVNIYELGVGRVLMQHARSLHPIADAEFGQDGFDVSSSRSTNQTRPAAEVAAASRRHGQAEHRNMMSDISRPQAITR